MTEKELQAKCIRWLKKNKIWHWKFQEKFRGGFPDLMVASDGEVLFIELKREGAYPTPLQRAVHETMRRAGLTVLVIKRFDEFRDCVTKWLKEVKCN